MTTIIYMLGSLILGFLAWGLAIGAIRGNLHLLIGSFAACAISLLFQLRDFAYHVRLENWSAIMDTIHASVLCSEIMLGVTVILAVIAIVRNKRK